MRLLRFARNDKGFARNDRGFSTRSPRFAGEAGFARSKDIGGGMNRSRIFAGPLNMQIFGTFVE